MFLRINLLTKILAYKELASINPDKLILIHISGLGSPVGLFLMNALQIEGDEGGPCLYQAEI